MTAITKLIVVSSVGVTVGMLAHRVIVAPPADVGQSTSGQVGAETYLSEAPDAQPEIQVDTVPGPGTINTASQAIDRASGVLPEDRSAASSVARLISLRGVDDYVGGARNWDVPGMGHPDQPVWLVGILVTDGVSPADLDMTAGAARSYPGFWVALNAGNRRREAMGFLPDSAAYTEILRLQDHDLAIQPVPHIIVGPAHPEGTEEAPAENAVLP